jgi:hypothetical protein
MRRVDDRQFPIFFGAPLLHGAGAARHAISRRLRICAMIDDVNGFRLALRRGVSGCG